MDIREKIAEITSACRSQSDLDAVVAKVGGLGALFAAEFEGADRAEFAYEWDRRKLAIHPMTNHTTPT